MSDEPNELGELPHAPFVKTYGFVVPSDEIFYASIGALGKFEPVSIEVAHGQECTFLVFRSGSPEVVQYIALDPIKTAVLGHALSLAVSK